MDFQQFSQSISDKHPPASLDVYLQAMWMDGKQDWESAHTLIQDLDDSTAAWIHAYLHRKEGDNSNADYWYRRAGKKRPSLSLSEEWKNICMELLSR